MQSHAQTRDWRWSSTGTSTGKKQRWIDNWQPSRVSAGTVFNEDAGFRLLVGQNEEFPLLQVKYIAKENCVSMMIRLGTSLSLLVRGTVWKSLEVASPPAKIPSSGDLRVTTTFPICAFSCFNYFRSFEIGESCSNNQRLQICLGGWFPHSTLEVNFLFWKKILKGKSHPG